MAEPRVEPTCRSVDVTEDAPPDRCGGTSVRITLVSWALSKPTPMP